MIRLVSCGHSSLSSDAMIHTITCEDVERGIKRNTTSCPVARSFRRVGFKYAHVRTWYSNVVGTDMVINHSEPLTVQISNFDFGYTGKFIPGEYQVYPNFMVGLDEF